MSVYKLWDEKYIQSIITSLWLGLRLSNLILKFNTQIDVIGTYISHTNQVIYPIWTIILNSCQNFGQKIGHFQPREIKMIDCMHVLSIDLLKIICKMLLKWEPSFCLIKVTTFSISKKYRPGNFIGQYACNCMLISYLTPLFVSGQTCRCACRYMTCIHVHKVLRYSWTQTPKTQSRPKIYTCIQVICDFFLMANLLIRTSSNIWLTEYLGIKFNMN